MTFKEWCEPILAQINVPVECNYGSIGTGYIQLLIVQDGIISIGEFVYNLWYYNHYVPDEIKIKLGQEAEKFRTGRREKIPMMCYHNDKVDVL